MTRLYRYLLRLYPKSFRERFGDEMVELLRDKLRDARRQRGRGGTVLLWCRSFSGLVVSAFHERLEAPRPFRRPALRRDSVLQDLKFSLRSFIKRPALTFAILLTLALGIGANSVMFTLVDTVLLRTLPFNEPDRLVTIWNRYDAQQTLSSPPDYIDRRDQSELIESITAISEVRMNLSGDGEPEQVQASRVTASFFEVFGVEALPAPVRFAHEEAAERDDAAVIGHGLVPTRLAPDFYAGTPVVLFERQYDSGGEDQHWGVAPDGQTFVMVTVGQVSATPIRLVLNWTEELRRLVPIDN